MTPLYYVAEAFRRHEFPPPNPNISLLQIIMTEARVGLEEEQKSQSTLAVTAAISSQLLQTGRTSAPRLVLNRHSTLGPAHLLSPLLGCSILTTTSNDHLHNLIQTPALRQYVPFEAPSLEYCASGALPFLSYCTAYQSSKYCRWLVVVSHDLLHPGPEPPNNAEAS